MKKRAASTRWTDDEKKIADKLVTRYTMNGRVDFNALDKDPERDRIKRKTRDIQQRYWVIANRERNGEKAVKRRAPKTTRKPTNEILPPAPLHVDNTKDNQMFRMKSLLLQLIPSRAYITFRLAGGEMDAWALLSEQQQKAWLELDRELTPA